MLEAASFFRCDGTTPQSVVACGNTWGVDGGRILPLRSSRPRGPVPDPLRCAPETSGRDPPKWPWRESGRAPRRRRRGCARL